MDDVETPSQPVEAEIATPARMPLTAEDLVGIAVEAPIADLKTCSSHDFRTRYAQAFRQAGTTGDVVAARVYGVMESLSGMSLRPRDRGAVWGAGVGGTTWRWAIPDDFLGPETQVLADLAPQLQNPGLRARVADVAWTNARALGATAAVAIEAYCDCAEGLTAGTVEPWLKPEGLHPVIEAVDPIHRALQIAHRTSKKTKRPARPGAVFTTVYDTARAERAFQSFRDLAEIALHFELRTAAEVAADAEALVAGVKDTKTCMVVGPIWRMAADLHDGLKDSEAKRRCLIGAYEQTLLMRQQVSKSAAADAHWVTEALQQLRHIDGLEAEEQALEIELKRLQKASLKEMRGIPVDLMIGDEANQTARHFESLDLAEALKQFALLASSPSPESLRQEAMDLKVLTPLSTMFGTVHLDGDGRPVARTPGAPHEGEPDPSWLMHMAQQFDKLRRNRAVGAAVHPARVVIQSRFEPQERHFAPIVAMSPFVPASQAPLMALGFTRFFQGDFMSAAHLLIPQIEPCLREVLCRKDLDPSKRRDNATEEDLSLDRLLDKYKDELGEILSPAIRDEIDRLFNASPGPGLRHEIAHGQLSAGGCFSHEVYYACWFLYRICALFLVDHWDETVRPELAAQGE